MAVIVQTDVEGRIGALELERLTDDDASGSVDTTILAKIIADGEGEILALVAQVYSLPLLLADTNTAAMVKAMLLDVIIFRLFMRRMPVPEEAIIAYKAAIARAEKIAAGVIGLPGESPLAEAPGTEGAIVIDAVERVISHENMAGL